MPTISISQRYVSTAEDEVQIDLAKVNTDLIEINKLIDSKTMEHNQYLSELGLNKI